PFFDTPQTPEKPLFLQRVNGYEPYQASSLTFLSPLEVKNTRGRSKSIKIPLNWSKIKGE
ncbi:hypothetical protein, partial [Microcystis wesenbergii]|uniref:hypothetical protein n=1 Tax=Microcystis wesenbergii TaxID=44823 RepID=UPI001A7E5912